MSSGKVSRGKEKIEEKKKALFAKKDDAPKKSNKKTK